MKLLFISALSILGFASCAQKYGIVKARAYARPNIPGIVQENERHKAPDTLYTVYLEIKKNSKQQWNHAFADNKKYSLVSAKVTPPVTVGISESTGETVVVNARSNHHLLQLTLEKPQPVATEKNGEGILLKGEQNNMPVYYRIKKIIRLRPALNE